MILNVLINKQTNNRMTDTMISEQNWWSFTWLTVNMCSQKYSLTYLQWSINSVGKSLGSTKSKLNNGTSLLKMESGQQVRKGSLKWNGSTKITRVQQNEKGSEKWEGFTGSSKWNGVTKMERIHQHRTGSLKWNEFTKTEKVHQNWTSSLEWKKLHKKEQVHHYGKG